MKFRIALLAILVTALVAGSVHAQTLRVTIRKAPIRSGPGSKEARVATAMEGDLLEFVDVEGRWYIVRIPSTQQVGYIHSALVEQTTQRSPAANRPTPAPPPQPAPPPAATPRNRSSAPPPPPRTTPPPREPEARSNTQPSIEPRTSDGAPWENRGFGMGFRMGHNTIGDIAFNLRTWGRGQGLSFDLASELGILQMQPSLMFKIGEPIEVQSVYLQPYIGVGANAWWDRNNDDFSAGVVALGGTDLGFTAVPNLTVSLDLGYFSDAINSDCGSDCFTSNFSDRLGLNFGVDWYLK